MHDRTLVVFVTLILVLAGMTGESFAEKRWISLDGSVSSEKPRAEVLVSNDSETVIRFIISGFWLDAVTEDGVTYNVLRFPGYSTTQDVGKAELPVINEYVAIPARAGVRAHIVDFEEATLDGYHVYPFQKVLHIGEKRTSFDIDRTFYAQNKVYPEPVRVSEPGIWRDLRLVNLRVAPVRYNPAVDELILFTSVTVRLEYVGENMTNAKMRAVVEVSPCRAASYDRIVLNYDGLDIPVLASQPDDNDYDLLIIAEDRFVDDLDSFTSWKQQKGYKSKVVAVSTIGTTAVEIKNFVEYEYENFGISYLLLVGTEEPAENAIPFLLYDNNGTASDYAYGTLEGSDWYPEIGVGRFSVKDETELANMITKSITYDSDPPDGDWLQKVALVAGQEGAPNGFQGCMEDIRLAEYTESGKYYSAFQPDFIKVYGATSAYGGTSATNQTLINTINTGIRAAGYYGHGMGIEWSDWNYLYQDFEINDLDQLDNAGQTPVVITQACLTAAPGAMGGCIGEHFTRGADGAVAYHGSTNLTITIDEYIKAIFTAIFDIGTPAISDATNEANMWTMRNISLWESHARRFLWYGDPTLGVIPSLDGPPAPEIVSPARGESIESSAPITLDWTDIGRVNGPMLPGYYQFQVDNNPDFSSPVIEKLYNYSEYTIPELGDGLYYWRIRTYHWPDYGPWSEAGHFFVGIPTLATTLVSPADHAMVKPSCTIMGSCTIGLTWQNSLNPGSYLLEIDDNADFMSPEVRIANSTKAYTLNTEGLIEDTKYYWRVCGMTSAAWPRSDVWSFTLGESSGGGGGGNIHIPTPSNYPNPFNPSTVIRFEMPRAGHVRLDVYNVNGQLVVTLEDGYREAGAHEVLWNGKNSRGVTVGSGMYFYRLETAGRVTNEKMLLLR